MNDESDKKNDEPTPENPAPEPAPGTPDPEPAPEAPPPGPAPEEPVPEPVREEPAPEAAPEARASGGSPGDPAAEAAPEAKASGGSPGDPAPEAGPEATEAPAAPAAGAAPAEGGGAPGAPAAPPVNTRLASRVRAVRDSLRGLVRELGAAHRGEKAPAELELLLKMVVHPENAWEVSFPAPLEEQLEEQLHEARARRAIFKKGRVHCFLCESSHCPHSHPTSSLTVFNGYNAHGVPQWGEFAQVLMDDKDPEVDQLFNEPPRHLVRQRSGKSLRSQQLSSFGRTSRSYSILGQVEIGYLLMRDKDPGTAPHRVAMTFQAVETRGAGGVIQLELNPLVHLPHGQDLFEVMAGGWNPWILRAYRLATRALEALAADANRKRKQGGGRDAHHVLGRVPGVLRQMSRSLEGGSGQSRRRTRHAEERRGQQRPVHKAIEDVSKITWEDMFLDGNTGNVVVCSDGRAHAFNREGRHVTTFVLPPGAVEGRVRSRRWQEVQPGEALVLKEQIEKHIRAAAAAPAEGSEQGELSGHADQADRPERSGRGRRRRRDRHRRTEGGAPGSPGGSAAAAGSTGPAASTVPAEHAAPPHSGAASGHSAPSPPQAPAAPQPAVAPDPGAPCESTAPATPPAAPASDPGNSAEG